MTTGNSKEFLNDFNDYLNSFGIVDNRPHPHGNGGNSARTMGESFLAISNFSPVNEKHDDIVAFGNQLANAMEQFEVQPGLTQAHPTGAFGYDSPDNIASHIFVDYMWGTGFSKRWLAYGELGAKEFDEQYEAIKPWHRYLFRALQVIGLGKAKYSYNNVRPGKWNIETFFGRFLHLKCLAKWMAGKKPTFLEKLVLTITMYTSAKHIGQDEKVLGTFVGLMADMYGGPVLRFLAKRWFKYFRQQYPGGLGEVLGAYYQNSLHPCAKYLQGYKGV